MSHKLLSSLIIMLIVAACAPATQPLEPTAAPATALSASLDEKVDVGGYKLRIICTGEGTPTVIVDSAIAEPALEIGSWTNVRYGVEKTTRICMYDRAGLGSSEASPSGLRTSQDMVKDLHTLLVNADISGPYLLVGHNLGGFNVRLYASQYPDEVAGMVLVDSLHPDYRAETLAVLPPESPNDPGLLIGRRTFLTEFVIETPESIDLLTSSDQVRTSNTLGKLPLVVISSGHAWLPFPDVPTENAEKVEQVWQDLQIDLLSLSSNSSHVLASNPGSFVLVDEHQLVIDAVLKIVSEARK